MKEETRKVCAESACGVGVTQNAAVHACLAFWDSSAPWPLYLLEWSSYKGLRLAQG